MAATDQDIIRLHERLDNIEKTLETRLRALEIWQAYQAGRLTALAVFFSALGALILWVATLFTRHFKLLLVIICALGAMLLSGCAPQRKASGPSTATVAGDISGARDDIAGARATNQAAQTATQKADAKAAVILQYLNR
ncbi:MAG: hypothetical protein ACFUZC_16640 [Chthoniobacteraceae bacterium]